MLVNAYVQLREGEECPSEGLLEDQLGNRMRALAKVLVTIRNKFQGKRIGVHIPFGETSDQERVRAIIVGQLSHKCDLILVEHVKQLIIPPPTPLPLNRRRRRLRPRARTINHHHQSGSPTAIIGSKRITYTTFAKAIRETKLRISEVMPTQSIADITKRWANENGNIKVTECWCKTKNRAERRKKMFSFAKQVLILILVKKDGTVNRRIGDDIQLAKRQRPSMRVICKEIYME